MTRSQKREVVSTARSRPKRASTRSAKWYKERRQVILRNKLGNYAPHWVKRKGFKTAYSRVDTGVYERAPKTHFQVRATRDKTTIIPQAEPQTFSVTGECTGDGYERVIGMLIDARNSNEAKEMFQREMASINSGIKFKGASTRGFLQKVEDTYQGHFTREGNVKNIGTPLHGRTQKLVPLAERKRKDLLWTG